jgi:hypothetical protein
VNWQLALVQHPMYLIIRDDCCCAERTPPWGSPDISAYIERLRANFAALRARPGLKIGFEWSGLELELLAQDAPDVFEEMLDLARRGQIAFYNGTYAQPHLQTLSAEANYRQFEVGAAVYRDLCGQAVRTYAHQETSLNEQTPQLLKAFGIRHAVLPHFITTLVIEGGELIYHAREGTMFAQGSEFASWRGLDGTRIDTYLPEPSHRPLPDWLAVQSVKGSLAVPPIIVHSPDMVAMDDAWLAKRAALDFVLLDEALPARAAQAPARFQARLFANWSYVEGIRAEELTRANWLAERSALQAEAMGVMTFILAGRPADSTDAIWKTILAAQHHDVACFCAPDLKEKSIARLRDAQEQAEHLTRVAADSLLPQIGDTGSSAEHIVVFNTVPHPVASPVSIEVPGANRTVLDRAGKPIACESVLAGPGMSRITFVARSDGLGYTTYTFGSGGPAAEEKVMDGPLTFENPFYEAVVQPDGTLSALRLLSPGLDLLETSAMRGGQLAATDSTSLGSRHEGTFDVTKPMPKLEPAQRGPELDWESIGPATLRRSGLGVTLETPGRLGGQVQVRTIVRLYHDLPWIELAWEFNFAHASIGTFFDDDSKLLVQWPLAFQGDVAHDIAFGVTSSLPDRPFFPASWVDVSDGEKGLAYFHQGTPKHWVKDGVLVNLLAWGEETDTIGNRLGLGRWAKSFDQRLNGRHTLRAAIYPHAGDWRAANVIGMARSFSYPPLAYLSKPSDGALPASLDLLALPGPDMHATAIRVEDGQVMCRVYSCSERPVAVEPRLNWLRAAGLFSLADTPLQQIGPYQIAKLRFEPESLGPAPSGR